jgi:hypothetical protein
MIVVKGRPRDPVLDCERHHHRAARPRISDAASRRREQLSIGDWEVIWNRVLKRHIDAFEVPKRVSKCGDRMRSCGLHLRTA